MIHGTHRAHQREAALPTYSSKSKTDSSGDSSSSSAAAFGDQLANALENYFTQSSDGSPLEFTITPQAGQDSGTRQFVVTLRDGGTTSAASSGATSSAAATTDAASATTPDSPTPLVNYGAMSPFSYGAAKYASEHPDDPTGTIAGAAASDTSSAQPAKPANEIDAYWAQFPEAVQALRNIPNREDRMIAASGLAQKGYTIDPEIMVAANDPYATMLIRQQTGYTWTPSMGQQPIDLAPGLQMAGHTPYDPLHPPAGSIPVSLDFAKGLESTSPAMQYNNITLVS